MFACERARHYSHGEFGKSLDKKDWCRRCGSKTHTQKAVGTDSCPQCGGPLVDFHDFRKAG